MLIYKIVIWICNNIDLLHCKLNSDCIHSLVLLGLLLRLDHPEALALPAERENIIRAIFPYRGKISLRLYTIHLGGLYLSSFPLWYF